MEQRPRVLIAIVLAAALALVAAQAASGRPVPVAPVVTTMPPITSAVATAPPLPTPTQGPIADGYRVKIPRLGIDLPITEGDIKRDITEQKTPEDFAFHLPGTMFPGQVGNTYLYAHARRGMFLALWQARAGDEVYVSTPTGGVLAYRVKEVLPKVAPNDVSVAQSDTPERLTLQTSTGPSSSDPRFVVFAYPEPAP